MFSFDFNFILILGLGENAYAKKSHEKYLIALKSSGLTYPEDKLVYGMQEPSSGTSTLAVQGLSKYLI
jgi:E3 ubiquitin-protein ligase UBR3